MKDSSQMLQQMKSSITMRQFENSQSKDYDILENMTGTLNKKNELTLSTQTVKQNEDSFSKQVNS